MLKKSKLPWLLLLIFIIEIAIYLWATITINDPDLIFEKCARNSGRLSTLINFFILLMVGHFGLNKIYSKERKKDAFRVLITLFAVNHLIHFYFVYQNFNSQLVELTVPANKLGFITFISILIMPFLLWSIRKMNTMLYFGVVMHLFLVTYFIMDTYYHRIKPERPEYLHQIGIGIMILCLIYILYRVVQEMPTIFRLNRK
ncbi:MAG: hypothetical protein ACSHXL_07970 [Bacteroidota bacterium]